MDGTKGMFINGREKQDFMAAISAAPAPAVEAVPKERLEYNPGVAVTGRGIKGYLSHFGIGVKALRGKRVVDMGAGRGVFGHECRALGIDVIELDQNYGYRRFVEIARDIFGPEHPFTASMHDTAAKIGAINEALPLKSGSVDILLACNSSLYWVAHNRDDGEAQIRVWLIISETLRVLKRGGKAYFTLGFDADKLQNVIRSVLSSLPANEVESEWRKGSQRLTLPRGCPMLKLTKRG